MIKSTETDTKSEPESATREKKAAVTTRVKVKGKSLPTSGRVEASFGGRHTIAKLIVSSSWVYESECVADNSRVETPTDSEFRPKEGGPQQASGSMKESQSLRDPSSQWHWKQLFRHIEIPTSNEGLCIRY